MGAMPVNPIAATRVYNASAGEGIIKGNLGYMLLGPQNPDQLQEGQLCYFMPVVVGRKVRPKQPGAPAFEILSRDRYMPILDRQEPVVPAGNTVVSLFKNLLARD